MSIQFTKSFACSDGNVFGTLALAQEHELILICKPLGHDPELLPIVAKHLLSNADKIVDILTTKANSRPKGRAINGAKRTRKPKTEPVSP